MKINLVYLSNNTTGGWVTYTAHLMCGFRDAGIPCKLFKVRDREENRERPFGYDCQYRNVTLRYLQATGPNEPVVIVALQKNFRDVADKLLAAGAWMVVHDPAEFKNLDLGATSRYITIRQAVQQQVPGSEFIPHPYKRAYPPGTVATGDVHACSIARIDFDKHTTIILDANRLLPEDEYKVQINGFENRLYTRFKVCPNYPEWKQSKAAYPRERTAAVDIAHTATFTVDMSIIKGDGGGTQYTFMEAMDAGSINIIHNDWVIPGDEMVPFPDPAANCFAVSDGEELADVLYSDHDDDVLDGIRRRSQVLLTRHSSKRIAKQFKRYLTQ